MRPRFKTCRKSLSTMAITTDVPPALPSCVTGRGNFDIKTHTTRKHANLEEERESKEIVKEKRRPRRKMDGEERRRLPSSLSRWFKQVTPSYQPSPSPFLSSDESQIASGDLEAFPGFLVALAAGDRGASGSPKSFSQEISQVFLRSGEVLYYSSII